MKQKNYRLLIRIQARMSNRFDIDMYPFVGLIPLISNLEDYVWEIPSIL